MKKAGIVLLFGGFLFLALFLIISMTGALESASPIDPVATEEQAYRYQYIAGELGVPWDIVMLADAVLADAADKNNIEDYNPMNTALEFCRIREEEFKPAIQFDEEGNPLLDEEGKELVEWVSTNHITYYPGASNIYWYIGKTEIEYKNAADVIVDITEAAEAKSTEEIRYEATLVLNPDYEHVLVDFLHLTTADASYILELYHANYMVYLYGYIPGDEFVELPDIVVGEVSRDDLAHVAVSILNHPYQLGGKSSAIGAPAGPLDCSGFVDWVYIQCFGRGVSSGRLPEGVAMSGTALQYYACTPIRESELKVGDLGFLYDPAKMGPGTINHVGIYIGKINGRNAFVHCAGKRYGYADRPTGRVGISINNGTNTYNPVTGERFEPAMKGCRFLYFRRPNFRFTDDGKE